MERNDHRLSILKREATSAPVHAPVPGRGIATNIIRARNIARVILSVGISSVSEVVTAPSPITFLLPRLALS